MNKINIYTILLVASFIALSCESDYLDVDPKDSISSEHFFNSPSDLELATNNFYSMLPSTSVYYGDEHSDNVLRTPASEIIRGNRKVPTARGSGGWDWGRLRDINYFLQNYQRVDDKEAQLKYSGVARFFRAYFYFNKVKRFGDVPWYNKVLEAGDEELYKSRDSRKLVVDSIMADIDYAIKNLPEQKELTQITKYTALLLKSRIALFEGTFRKYHGIGDYESLLKASIESTEELMASGAYTLFQNGEADQVYGNLFTQNKVDDTEVILKREYNKDEGHRHNFNKFTSETAAAYGIPKDMINSYLMRDGSRFTDISGYDKMGFYEEMQNRDPRLTQTTAGPNFTVLGESSPEPVNLKIATTGYRVIKGLPPKNEWSATDNDIIIFRYAEALLNYAEAKAELGEISQNDLDQSINLIRERVDMPRILMDEVNAIPDPYLMEQYPNVSEDNKGLILEIRRERRIELFNENFRRDDIMRWKEGKRFERPIMGIYFSGLGSFDFNSDGKADVFLYKGSSSDAPSTVTSKINVNERELTDGDSGNLIPFTGGHFDESRDYYDPIPKEDLQLNDKLEQNPNWK